jgi:hypothetical protein
MRQWLRAASTLDKVSTRNVLSPLLWLDALMLICIAAAGHFLPTYVMVWLMVLLSVVFLVTIAAYLYFAWTAPDLLRSESFSLRQSALDICGSRDVSGEDLSLILNADQVSAQAYMEDKSHGA